MHDSPGWVGDESNTCPNFIMVYSLVYYFRNLKIDFRDIHKDLACLVMTITPPNATTPSAQIKAKSKLTNNYMRDLALYRWDQFNFLLTFQRLVKKEISSRWDDVIAKTLRNARKHARLEAERKRLQESLDFQQSSLVPIQASCPQVP